MEPLISTSDSDIVAPAAGLLTLFCGAPKNRWFGTQLFRRLLQTIALTLTVEPEIGSANEDLLENYQVNSQQLVNLFDRWGKLGWIEGDEDTAKTRNKKRFQLTPVGTAGLMSIVCRCEKPLRSNQADRLLSALFVVDSFPLEVIREHMPKVEKHLGKNGAITATQWQPQRMRERFTQELGNKAKAYSDMSREIKTAAKTIRGYQTKFPDTDFAQMVNERIRVVRTDQGDQYEFDGKSFKIDPALEFYFPGLAAFRNQRDQRSIEEQGLQPLHNFYKEFNHSFIHWHLFTGFEQLGHLYDSYAKNLSSTVNLIQNFRSARSR